MPADDDLHLARRLVAGDESALREVYRCHAGAVHGLARRVLGNGPLAEEVTQDVFVRLWEHPERYDPGRGRLRSFLLTSAHSRAVERVRGEESLRRRHRVEARSRPDETADDPATLLADRHAAHAVRAELARLPSAEREAIELAYFGGLSYREVADHLGAPEGTVKYRIRAGMQRMRAALRAIEVTP